MIYDHVRLKGFTFVGFFISRRKLQDLPGLSIHFSSYYEEGNKEVYEIIKLSISIYQSQTEIEL